jgi:hypothetical protein
VDGQVLRGRRAHAHAVVATRFNHPVLVDGDVSSG